MIHGTIPAKKDQNSKCKWRLNNLDSNDITKQKKCDQLGKNECKESFPSCQGFTIENVPRANYLIELFAVNDPTLIGNKNIPGILIYFF